MASTLAPAPINTAVVAATLVPTKAPTTTPPTITPPTTNPQSQDIATITEATRTVLAGYPFTLKSVDPSRVDYSSAGWPVKEPLIREVRLSGTGAVSIWFSAWHDGGKYVDVSDYNSAEEAAVEIAATVRDLKLSIPLTDIVVAAWAPLPLPSCSAVRMDRMAFIHLTMAQFPLITFDQWGDLNGDEMFAAMKKQGITTEIYNPYLVCRHP